MDSLPPGVFIARSYPSPSKQVHVSPATRLLLSEIIACTDEIWHSLERLDLQFEGICRIRNLVHPLGFVALLLLFGAKDGEFLRQHEWVKQWANPGPELLHHELSERGNRLVAEGRKALKSPEEPGASDEVIGIAATRDEGTARRRHGVV